MSIMMMQTKCKLNNALFMFVKPFYSQSKEIGNKVSRRNTRETSSEYSR